MHSITIYYAASVTCRGVIYFTNFCFCNFMYILLLFKFFSTLVGSVCKGGVTKTLAVKVPIKNIVSRRFFAYLWKVCQLNRHLKLFLGCSVNSQILFWRIAGKKGSRILCLSKKKKTGFGFVIFPVFCLNFVTKRYW